MGTNLKALDQKGIQFRRSTHSSASLASQIKNNSLVSRFIGILLERIQNTPQVWPPEAQWSSRCAGILVRLKVTSALCEISRYFSISGSSVSSGGAPGSPIRNTSMAGLKRRRAILNRGDRFSSRRNRIFMKQQSLAVYLRIVFSQREDVVQPLGDYFPIPGSVVPAR